MENNKYLLDNCEYIPSSNFDERKENSEIDTIIIHCISLPEGSYDNDNVISFFTNKLNVNTHPSFINLANLRVSSHLYIKRDGHVIQFVPTDKRAWHAGESSYNGRSNFNDFSIGIELEGMVSDQYTDAQYRELSLLIDKLKDLYPSIKDDNILGHSDIAPDRKGDPGKNFKWEKIK